ncbi:MAG: hypothetical protein Q8L29_00050 [archaeon]|nr:hypothetical protein [archaeon]
MKNKKAIGRWIWFLITLVLISTSIGVYFLISVEKGNISISEEINSIPQPYTEKVLISCIDPDKNDDSPVAGYSGFMFRKTTVSLSDDSASAVDSCVDNCILLEQSCVGDKITSYTHNCPSSYKCKNGAFVASGSSGGGSSGGSSAPSAPICGDENCDTNENFTICPDDCELVIIKDYVTCEFLNNEEMVEQSCNAGELFSCNDDVNCTVEVNGSNGQILNWESTCAGSATTTIDGINETIEFDCSSFCTDSDDGNDYFIEGDCSDYLEMNLSDGCIIEEDDWVREINCVDSKCTSNDYQCPSGSSCENGMCTGYEILGESMNLFNGNLVELDGEVNFKDIYYNVIVPESQLDKVDIALNKIIETPSGAEEEILFGKDDEYCYEDMDYPNRRVCNIQFSGMLDIGELGEYTFTDFNNEDYLVAYGVPEGYFADKLVLDEKYSPDYWYGEYSIDDESINLDVDYAPDNNKLKAKIEIFLDEDSAIFSFNNILKYIGNEETYTLSLINENNVYLFEAEESNNNIDVVFWRSGNSIVIVYQEVYEDSNLNVLAEDFGKVLADEGYNINRNVQFDSFSEILQDLIKDYIVKYPSSLEEGACVPNWECTITPIVCPKYGKQTKTCEDKNSCGIQEVITNVSCSIGSCSGCMNEETCIQYGYRFISKDGNPSYCDIDGTLKVQKLKDSSGDWAKCQNNYECESNLCSSGECADIKGAIEKTKGLKALFIRALCRMGNLFDENSYQQCLADNLL